MPKILITRDKEQASEFAAHLQNYGIDPVFFPTIEIVENEDMLTENKIFQNITEYTDIIFTSLNGVKYFFKKIAGSFDLNTLKNKRFFTVGLKTKAYLEKFGFDVFKITDKSNFTELILTIFEQNKFDDRKFLFPHGNLTDEKLISHFKQRNIYIDSFVIYQTIPAKVSDLLKESTWNMIKTKEIWGVTFFSPSSVEFLLNIFSEFIKLENIVVAVIGDTTAKYCLEKGLKVRINPANSNNKTSSEILSKLIYDEIRLEENAKNH